MNKIGFEKLEKIKDELGDFEIGQVWGGGNPLYLRFGYWFQKDVNKIQEIIGNSARVIESEIYDDDCGWKYSYHLT